MVTECGRIAGAVLLSHFPYVLAVGGAELDRTGADAFRYRHIAVAVSGLGRSHHSRALEHVDGLSDVDERTIGLDVSRLQRKQLL